MHTVFMYEEIFWKLYHLSLYNDGCDYGEPSACNNLANMYAHGSFGVQKDPIKAEQYFSKACDLDDAVSCNKLVSIKKIKSEVDFNQAKKACDHNGATGCYKLGEFYASTDEEEKRDEDKALYYLTKACDLGQSQACKRIGDFHKNGNKF